MFPRARIPYGTWGSSYFPAWQTSALAEVNIGQFAGEAMNRILGKQKGPQGASWSTWSSARPIPWHWKFWNAPLVASCLGTPHPRLPHGAGLRDRAAGRRAGRAPRSRAASNDVVGVLTFDRTSDSPVGVFPERRAYERTHGARATCGTTSASTRPRARR